MAILTGWRIELLFLLNIVKNSSFLHQTKNMFWRKSLELVRIEGGWIQWIALGLDRYEEVSSNYLLIAHINGTEKVFPSWILFILLARLQIFFSDFVQENWAFVGMEFERGVGFSSKIIWEILNQRESMEVAFWRYLEDHWYVSKQNCDIYNDEFFLYPPNFLQYSLRAKRMMNWRVRSSFSIDIFVILSGNLENR